VTRGGGYGFRASLKSLPLTLMKGLVLVPDCPGWRKEICRGTWSLENVS
jgi:hypothetical protein